MNAVKDDIVKSNTYQVNQFDRESYTFYVRETINYGEGRPMRTFKGDLQAELEMELETYTVPLLFCGCF